MRINYSLREVLKYLKGLHIDYPNKAPFAYILMSDGSCGIIDKDKKQFKELPKVLEE